MAFFVYIVLLNTQDAARRLAMEFIAIIQLYGSLVWQQ